jgi:predicted ATP-dependent endonuclease of OLD family
MIFEIEIIVQEFKRDKDKKPADINLLFIEEPEAHTHPQMQYVFIKNIKELLGDGIKRDDGENRILQYIITTHSSHIVADSDFDDIKYLKIQSTNNVTAKT